MKHIGWFSEMNISAADSGSVKNFIAEKETYDKEKVIAYLKAQKRVAGCPKAAIDCVTGEEISPSYSVYTDGEYDWCDFLIYHIEKYNVLLPQDFVEHIMKMAA